MFLRFDFIDFIDFIYFYNDFRCINTLNIVTRLIIYCQSQMFITNVIIDLLTREALKMDAKYVMAVLKRIPRIVFHNFVLCYLYNYIYVYICIYY